MFKILLPSYHNLPCQSSDHVLYLFELLFANLLDSRCVFKRPHLALALENLVVLLNEVHGLRRLRDFLWAQEDLIDRTRQPFRCHVHGAWSVQSQAMVFLMVEIVYNGVFFKGSNFTTLRRWLVFYIRLYLVSVHLVIRPRLRPARGEEEVARKRLFRGTRLCAEPGKGLCNEVGRAKNQPG